LKEDLIIAPSMGTNIVNNGGDVYQHYYVATSVGSIEIKDAASRKFVNFVLNSASNAVIDDDDRFLYAKPHAGSMTVLRFSP
jgi:hypothetical protein